ncbi:hypothetical protein, partial [Actinocatenispora comari]|uniref:hypothetical protein n=1 Tax=Actinocatenispora comari TaxID=2807577 RepID=UPI001A93968D
ALADVAARRDVAERIAAEPADRLVRQLAKVLAALVTETSWRADPAGAAVVRPARSVWPVLRGVLVAVLLAGAAGTRFLPRQVWAPLLAAALAIAAAAILGGPNALPRRIAANLADRLRRRRTGHRATPARRD